MELTQNSLIPFGKMKSERFDCIIAAAGYQKRSTYIACNIELSHATKLLITFKESFHSDLRKQNEHVFNAHGFTSVKASPDDSAPILSELHKIFSFSNSDELNILIDYSCMTKTWYAAILDFLLRREFNSNRINIFFGYTPKSINLSPSNPGTISIAPILPTNESVKNLKNSALIIGLNSDSAPSSDIISWLNPTETYAFVPDFMHDKTYFSSLLNINSEVIGSLPQQNIIKYPADRPDQTTSILTSVCLPLRLKSGIKVVLQGPKTFALSSILLSIRYPDIQLWDVITKERKSVPDVGLAAGEPVIMKSEFCADTVLDDY